MVMAITSNMISTSAPLRGIIEGKISERRHDKVDSLASFRGRNTPATTWRDKLTGKGK